MIDPETYLDNQTYIGIKEDHIAAVSETPLEGKEVIDVSGVLMEREKIKRTTIEYRRLQCRNNAA